MAARTLTPDIAALGSLVGKELGPSEWIEIDQERIDAFANATGDHQWIHTDPERARRESPFGGTIAHGHLTLSLAPRLLRDILEVKGARFLVNPGIEKVRLRSPVHAGDRVRMRGTVTKLREIKGGAVRATLHMVFEIEGESRPAAFGDVLLVLYP
jgi:acyl dehydratase